MEYKVVLVGERAEGKTALFNALRKRGFSLGYRSTMAAESVKCKLVLEKEVIIRVFDIPDWSRFRSLMRLYLKNTDAVVICDSLWEDRAKRIEHSIRKLKIPTYKVLTKADLHPNDTGRNLWYVSAKENKGINSLFTNIAHDLCSTRVASS